MNRQRLQKSQLILTANKCLKLLWPKKLNPMMSQVLMSIQTVLLAVSDVEFA